MLVELPMTLQMEGRRTREPRSSSREPHAKSGAKVALRLPANVGQRWTDLS